MLRYCFILIYRVKPHLCFNRGGLSVLILERGFHLLGLYSPVVKGLIERLVAVLHEITPDLARLGQCSPSSTSSILYKMAKRRILKWGFSTAALMDAILFEDQISHLLLLGKIHEGGKRDSSIFSPLPYDDGVEY